MSTVELEPRFCDRVAIFAQLRHHASGLGVVVANTHLTVAHANNSHDIPMCRPTQMAHVLRELGARSVDGALPFLCADMNSDHLETEPPDGPYTAQDVSRPVHMAFEKGFASALHEARPQANFAHLQLRAGWLRGLCLLQEKSPGVPRLLLPASRRSTTGHRLEPHDWLGRGATLHAFGSPPSRCRVFPGTGTGAGAWRCLRCRLSRCSV